MNSWEIIKEQMTRKEYAAGSFGRLMQVNDAADMLIALSDNLKDQDAALDLFNADEEVIKAASTRGMREKLRDTGVIR